MRAKLQSVAIGAVIAMLAILAAPAAQAQAAFTFDLPAQPLADSLRDVASVTRINIVFDPAVVAGLEAPPLKGNASAHQALAKLLAGTRLHSIDVGESTVRIARITDRRPSTHRSRSAAPEARDKASPPGPDRSEAGQPASPGNSDTTTTAVGATVTTAEGWANLNQVVVTGTRIAGVEPASPVITIGRTEINESGYSSVGQLLLSLPENFSGGQNPGVLGARGHNLDVDGASSPDLLGLGADSTLTLVDGHRLAYDGFNNGVDLSAIPLAAVDRIEILTDGASGIYGSDAVAGVVNVILKQHYEGVTADARYGDVTSGQAAQSQYSILAGHDWGSGNVVVAYEYAHDDALYASERPFSLAVDQPTSLYPELNRSSAFLTAHQSLWSNITASVDALFTHRADDSVVTIGSPGAELIAYGDNTVTEWGVTPDLTIALPDNWNLTLDGTLSKNRDSEGLPYYEKSTLQLLANDFTYYLNEMRLGEVQATGPLVSLPSGPVKLALGVGYRHESFENGASHQSLTRAGRDVRYEYAEADVPLVKPDANRVLLEELQLTASYRHERYSDFGSESTPKVGLDYHPIQSVRLRGTWSKSFRAPELLDAYGPRQLYVVPANYLGGASGQYALLVYGSNPAIGPETATSTTAGIDLSPRFTPGWKLSATYFEVEYDHRIVSPIDNTLRSLSDPAYAPFITRNPTAAEQAALVAQSTFFQNQSAAPYNPGDIIAVANDAYQNATSQHIRGVDLRIRGRFPALLGRMSVTANGAWLTLRQQTISTEPAGLLSGTIFNPPSFKGRVMVSWMRAGWSATAADDYTSAEWDDSNTPAIRVGSLNTVNVQLSYAFGPSSNAITRGLRISLSAQNLFDRYPPFVAGSSTTYPGLGYDSTNASPFGRFVSAYVSKSW